ncbi:MAG: GFA family protein [Deltaproteobacteria bacterium]|jgi:hypothetical protein|nr:GFA family protein [Deltaproteobacteria bacterium]MBW2498299.1 GFA family protein [Deltaproteobacteria bacterium]
MYTGECFCGEVKYEINGELFAMYCCHCSKCRKMCGASFTTNGSVEASAFRITHGREVSFSSRLGTRYVCGQCHSWLYSDGYYEGTVIFPCGTLNEPPGRGIDFHCNVDSKAEWVEITDGKDQYPGFPPEERLIWRPNGG